MAAVKAIAAVSWMESLTIAVAADVFMMMIIARQWSFSFSFSLVLCVVQSSTV